MNSTEQCRECERLRALLKEARQAGDLSRAVDSRVLLRRHPSHGGVPVTAAGPDA
ncbi:hypothetical protein ABZ714_31030 [Streptomyces sp. NPDC006798]|uniref:hypothetical protein n=1 Tax=Streptomyces sp. NPDC006798 TaxID=3155462 RepID=UPI0033FED888